MAQDQAIELSLQVWQLIEQFVEDNPNGSFPIVLGDDALEVIRVGDDYFTKHADAGIINDDAQLHSQVWYSIDQGYLILRPLVQ